MGRIVLALAPSNPNILYVSIGDNGLGGVNVGRLLGLWRTDNAWATTPAWSQVPTGAIDDGGRTYGYCGWQVMPIPGFPFNPVGPKNACAYAHVLAVHPSNPSVLYAGGVDLWRYDGATWVPIGTDSAGLHADQHALAWAAGRLIVGNDGGVFSTADDGGTPWQKHNATLSITQFYDGVLHPTNPLIALGGVQDLARQMLSGSGRTAGTRLLRPPTIPPVW